ncbi:MAG: TadG family pilus assembly protein [Tepidisphaeraceae bacterium]|jgi:Flp pilus assembly protein TadG
MRTRVENLARRSRRRGIAVIYVLFALIVMLGFCSLAVDLGRVQTAKTELRRAVDAAARSGAASLPQGLADVQKAALDIASKNKVDNLSLTLNTTDVQIGIWNKSTQTFSKNGSADYVTTFNAVQVIGRRTKANGNPIPLVFGSILGASTCDVNATAVAALISIGTPRSVYVSAHGNPWLAGEPFGTLGSVPDNDYDKPKANDDHPWKYDIANPADVDTSSTIYADSTKVESTDYSTGEPYGSPAEFKLTVTPGSVVQVSIPLDSSNVAVNHGYLDSPGSDVTYYADGSSDGSIAIYSDDAANPNLPQGSVTTSGSEHGISNIATPINSVVGVFLNTSGGQVPDDQGAPPPGLDYSTQTDRDYTSIEPDLRQSFYVGNGETSTGVQQTIVVPPNANTLFLGTMDGHEWSNNQGGYHATITEFQIELVH